MDDTVVMEQPRGGFLRSFFRGVWWLITFIPYGFSHFFRFLWEIEKKLQLMLWQMTKAIATGTDSDSDYLAQSRLARWLAIATMGILHICTTILPFVVIAIIIGGILIPIDQATAPNHDVDQRFTMIDSTPDDGKPVSDIDIGVSLLEAVKHQMTVELETPIQGWTPNDMFGLQFFDNRVNRQLGIRQATIDLMTELQHITNYGDSDVVDQRIIDAKQGFVTDPYWWFDPGFAESGYYGAIEDLDDFIVDVRAGKPGVVINITNEDKRDIFIALDQVFAIPKGRLIDSASLFGRWFQTDDDVYYAKGLGLVARDILVVMRNSFEDDFRQRGMLVNVDEAIAALNDVAEFHPSVTFTSWLDSLVPDHRAKLSQRIEYVRGRLDNVIRAYNN